MTKLTFTKPIASDQVLVPVTSNNNQLIPGANVYLKSQGLDCRLILVKNGWTPIITTAPTTTAISLSTHNPLQVSQTLPSLP